MQHRDRGLVLPEVRPGTRRNDEQLDRLVRGELVAIGRPVHVDGPLRPAQGALAVGEYSQVRELAAHPVVRPQLSDCCLPLAGAVGSKAHRLPYRRNARSQPARDQRMRERRLGLLVDELPGGQEA